MQCYTSICILATVIAVQSQPTKTYDDRQSNRITRSKNAGVKWGLLVAGSEGFSNYRHQADVCHAWQLLRSHGIPKKNLIIMINDDIANNPENPRKGVIINKPDGPNVYSKVVKDYTGKDVNDDNFLKILRGDKTAMKGIGSGKVIESGPDDTIFVYYSDHGGPGTIAFPHGNALSSYALNKQLVDMAKNKSFSKNKVEEVTYGKEMMSSPE